MQPEMVWCLLRGELVEASECIFIFRTGFRRVNGADYPLARCADIRQCPFLRTNAP